MSVVTKSLYFLAFITCFSNHHKLYTIWKLKISTFILWKPFWNRRLRYHRNGTLKYVLTGSSPLAAVSYYKMHYGLLESKRFIILTKYISLERSESQDSICRGYFVIGVILREKLIDLWQKMEFGWHPVAVCGITPKQNCIWTSIFFISTSNLEHNLCRHSFNFIAILDF